MDKVWKAKKGLDNLKTEQFEADEMDYFLASHNAIKKQEGFIEGLRAAWQIAELLDEQQTITEQLKQKLFGGTNEN